MIELTFQHLTALGDIVRSDYRPYKITLENVGTVNLVGGETLLGDKLLVATLYFDDQRDGKYESRYLLGSALTGGTALRLDY